LNGLLQACVQFKAESIPVHTAGHSLGAAYTTLFGTETIRRYPAMLAATPFSIQDMYSIGSPRVGESDFENAFEGALGKTQHIHRVANADDMVTTMPPCFSDLAYIHLSTGWKISTDQDAEKLPEETLDTRVIHKGDFEHHQIFPDYYDSLVRAMSA